MFGWENRLQGAAVHSPHCGLQPNSCFRRPRLQLLTHYHRWARAPYKGDVSHRMIARFGSALGRRALFWDEKWNVKGIEFGGAGM